MMYKLLFLTFALAMNKSASQNLEATPSCIEEGTTVTLRCETTNFTSAIFFFIGSNSKGGCFSSGTCNTAIDGYEQPTQSGTYTEMIITAYNHSKDGGDWTCSFGGISSNIYTVKLGDCSENSIKVLSTGEKIGIAFGVIIPVSGLMVFIIWYKNNRDKKTGPVKDATRPLVANNAGGSSVATDAAGSSNATDAAGSSNATDAAGSSNVNDGAGSSNAHNTGGSSVGGIRLMFVNEGANIELGEESKTDNSTKVKTRWTHNGNEDLTHIMDGTKMKIYSATAKDGGLYVCKRSNDQMELTYQLIVNGAVELHLVNKGTEITLGKNIADDNAQINAVWTHNGEQNALHTAHGTQLNIPHVTANDAGLYVCTFAIANEMQLKYFLIVNGAIQFQFINDGCDIELGTDLLEKYLTERPAWTHNGTKYESPQIRGTKMRIKRAKATDEGLYVCTFAIEERVQLKYYFVVNGHKELINVNEGGNIEFGRDIEDEIAKPLKFEWTHDGKKAKQNKKKGKFIIREATEKDEGLYICKFGPNKEVHTSYQLKVNETNI